MKKIFHSAYNSLEQFFFAPNSRSEFLVFFRVSIGLVALLHFLATLQDFERLFSSRSIVPQDIATVFHPEWLLSFPKLVEWAAWAGISEGNLMLGIQVLYPLLCLAIVLGFFSRAAAGMLLLLQISLVKGSSFFVYGADFFTSMSLFYLILFPGDRFFSLRNLLRKHDEIPVNFTPVKRMFQLHLSIAYFFSGLDKVLGFNWHNGEAIWKAINLPYANRDFFFDFTWMAQYPVIFVGVGWATVLIEMLYPVFIWIPKTRRVWLIFTVAMHLGIALVLNLYYFSAIMIVWNLSNFYFEKGAPWSFRLWFNPWPGRETGKLAEG